MSELWDVYTIDRKLIGKTCIRGEQGKLADDTRYFPVFGFFIHTITQR